MNNVPHSLTRLSAYFDEDQTRKPRKSKMKNKRRMTNISKKTIHRRRKTSPYQQRKNPFDRMKNEKKEKLF